MRMLKRVRLLRVVEGKASSCKAMDLRLRDQTMIGSECPRLGSEERPQASEAIQCRKERRNKFLVIFELGFVGRMLQFTCKSKPGGCYNARYGNGHVCACCTLCCYE